MLDKLVPRFRAGARLQPRDDGTAVLADAPAGRYLEVAADEASLAALIDGRRTIAEIVAAHFEQHGAVSFLALGDLLARLRTAGELENGEAELDAAGVERRKRPHPVRQAFSTVLLRVRGAPLAMAFALLGSTVGLLLCAAAALTSRRVGGHGGFDPLLPDGSAVAGLVGMLTGLSLALTLRSLVRAAVTSVFGARPAALELRLHFGLPALGVDGGQIQLLPRVQRIAAYLVTMLAPWALVVGAATLAIHDRAGAAFASVALGAAIVGLFDSMPFAPSSLGHALAAFARRIDLRDHARAYLSRRLVSRVGSKDAFDGENALVLSSTLSVAWILATILAISRLGAPQFARLLNRAVTAQGSEAYASRAAAALVLVAVVGIVIEIGFLLVVAVGSAAPRVFRMPIAAGRTQDLAPADAAEALRRVPIFSGLSAAILAELAREVTTKSFAARAIIVRQGDPGDNFYAVVRGEVEVIREHDSGLRTVVATLREGDGFGETALLATVPRTATVRAAGPVQLLSISRAGLDRLVKALPGLDLTRALRASGALHRSGLAPVIPPERIAEMVPRLVERNAAAQETLCRVGDPGDFFYLIDQGEVEILNASGKRIAVLTSGESFGETALMMDTARTATARCLSPTSLWALSRVDLYTVLSRNPALSEVLTHQAETRVAPGIEPG